MNATETSPAAMLMSHSMPGALRGAETPTPTITRSTSTGGASAWDQAPEPTIGWTTSIAVSLVPDQATAAAMVRPAPTVLPPLPSQTTPGQSGVAYHLPHARVITVPDGHTPTAIHSWCAVGDQTPPVQPIDEPESNDSAAGLADEQDQQAARGFAEPRPSPPLADPLLALLAETLDDLEKVRIAQENRLRQLTRDVEDKDGEVRGFGLDERNPQVAKLSGVVDAISTLEHEAVLNLQRRLRQHPLAPWVKRQKGIGEKQAARLLAAIGDPYWNDLHQRPRTVSELWAFCGLHVLPDEGVAAHRRKGVQANWSTTAKTRAYLIATSCIKQLNSPYRSAYQHRRDRTAHTHPEWTPLHAHNDALRITAKTILKDLWRAAKQCHEETP